MSGKKGNPPDIMAITGDITCPPRFDVLVDEAGRIQGYYDRQEEQCVQGMDSISSDDLFQITAGCGPEARCSDPCSIIRIPGAAMVARSRLEAFLRMKGEGIDAAVDGIRRLSIETPTRNFIAALKRLTHLDQARVLLALLAVRPDFARELLRQPEFSFARAFLGHCQIKDGESDRRSSVFRASVIDQKGVFGVLGELEGATPTDRNPLGLSPACRSDPSPFDILELQMGSRSFTYGLERASSGEGCGPTSIVIRRFEITEELEAPPVPYEGWVPLGKRTFFNHLTNREEEAEAYRVPEGWAPPPMNVDWGDERDERAGRDTGDVDSNASLEDDGSTTLWVKAFVPEEGAWNLEGIAQKLADLFDDVEIVDLDYEADEATGLVFISWTITPKPEEKEEGEEEDKSDDGSPPID